ncbi:radical SAM additional 4Fe4S-binding SPASM domain-containing protein [Caloranaerobacter azorensis DSM 13643]|uniref:Radical SAM additional 4Fe4S-binding SPASM domain-containing protein n=1 Tax=Caloranaerobacter azorensis DSM 13643 TaxID=1121264 RepID=A0A1M5S1H4_9FIRM|nr:radical SAM protein [Caloranaerobacter azorensis]SHH32336.1 radical SAM additional 4Fe4S-binding SPASM domain-containing protein [Caloranaerobacter azorensis DSM 13643]
MVGFKRTLLWDITPECNLRCKHCYNAEKYFGENRKNDVLSYSQCIDVINKLVKGGFDHIHLLGGEPLMRKDIFDIISYANLKGVTVTINTNGALLDEQNIEKLIESGIKQISISLDSTDPQINDNIRGVGTFRKVIENIALLKSKLKKSNKYVLIQISTVIIKNNAEDIINFPKILKELGINVLNVLSLYKCGNANRNKELLYDLNIELRAIKRLIEVKNRVYPDLFLQLDCKPIVARYLNRVFGKKYIEENKSVCRAGESIWLLEPNGDIYPCGSCNLSTAEACKREGKLKGKPVNILELEYFENIENHIFYKSFRKLKEENKHNKRLCKVCEFNSICDGACPLKLEDEYSICDVISQEEQRYYDKLKFNRYKICENVLTKIDDKESVLFRMDEGVVKRFNNWKSLVLKYIENNEGIKDIYSELLRSGYNISEIELSRFLLDLKCFGYIKRL